MSTNHPHRGKTIEEVKTDIMRVVHEKPKGFNLSFLKLRLGEICLYEDIAEALDILVKEGKIVQRKEVTSSGKPLYDVA